MRQELCISLKTIDYSELKKKIEELAKQTQSAIYSIALANDVSAELLYDLLIPGCIKHYSNMMRGLSRK